jgi:cytidyltransferase-like protein
MNEDIVIVTGGFDPIHSGHIEYINAASKLGRVVIGLNSDEWLARKKGRPFMNYSERLSVVSSLKGVMCVIEFDDSDGTAKDAIVKTRKMFTKNKIIFVNGGDRTEANVPEMDIEDRNLEFAFGIGGETKKNSSSSLLDNWKAPVVNRLWGNYETYYETNGCKVKRLCLSPGKSISMQYHEHRCELWFIENGFGSVSTIGGNGQEHTLKIVRKNDYHLVPSNTWHKVTNIGHFDLDIVEIQYGNACVEDDIIRTG